MGERVRVWLWLIEEIKGMEMLLIMSLIGMIMVDCGFWVCEIEV